MQPAVLMKTEFILLKVRHHVRHFSHDMEWLIIVEVANLITRNAMDHCTSEGPFRMPPLHI